MMTRRIRCILVAALLGVTAWLYTHALGSAPVYISPDEAIIAVDAHAIAATGADLRGERFPLYFRVQMPGEERFGWFTPAIFYLSAALMKVLPFNEATVRLPAALLGIVDVFLLFVIVRELLASDALALLAAAFLTLTPAQLILSRYALDYTFPAPFVLAWFWALARYVARGDRRLLFFGGLALGVGFYSYISSIVMVPLYVVMTVFVVWHRDRRIGAAAPALAGFALPLVPFVPWYFGHPTAFADTAQRYAIYDARTSTALGGLRQYASYAGLDRLLSTYWRFFDPAFLFLTGDRQPTFSTRRAGVFALPLIVLIPLGLFEILRHRRRPLDLLAAAVLLTAPCAAVLVPEDPSIIRAAVMMPFGALLAGYGAAWLWRGRAVARLGAALLIVLVPLQFWLFTRDYFGDYRDRSAPWLDGNLRGALETLIDRQEATHAPMIYFARIRSTAGLLDTRNRWMDAYWRFYLIKHRREDLLAKSQAIDTNDASALPPGSLVLANDGDRVTAGLVASGQLKKVATILERDGQPFFLILVR
jgi:4-amino-4-deoxy-L-arabinose transferase-like glycosyltransferase